MRVTRSVIGSKEVMNGGLEARERRPALEGKFRAQPGMMGQSGKIQILRFNWEQQFRRAGRANRQTVPALL